MRDSVCGSARAVSSSSNPRSPVFQILSAAGLALTAALAALVATGEIPPWVWWLWALLTLHAVASILVVHARLERRARAQPRTPTPLLLVPLAAALALVSPLLSLAPLFSALALWLELRRLHTPAGLREPLIRVGLRTLALSLLHTAITVASLSRLPASIQ